VKHIYSVLHVDDESVILMVTKAFLEKYNCSVDGALSAEEALVKLQHNSYDVIVSDYEMSEMDGITLLKAIREKNPDIPFIIFTGKGREDVVIEALNEGADYYLQKGGEPDAMFRELAHKIQKSVERIEILQALKDSEKKCRRFMDTSGDMYFRTDIEGNIVWVNQESYKKLGFDSYDEIVGLPANATWVYPKKREEYLDLLRQHGNINEYEVKLKKVDGSIITGSTNSYLIYDSEGNACGVEGIIRDISRRKQAEYGLKIASKKLNLLSSVTQHDILNQITGILTLEEQMLRIIDEGAIKDIARFKLYLEKMQSATIKIETLIEFARNYQQLGQFHPEWQRVDPIIRSILKMNNNGSIEITINTGNLEIFSDPTLEKVFYNLFDNSLRHGDKATQIGVYFEEKENIGVLVIEDNGKGIPIEMKEKIFQPNIGSHTRHGLFLVREILDITGLDIQETGTPGFGARFEILIPIEKYRLRMKLKPELRMI